MEENELHVYDMFNTLARPPGSVWSEPPILRFLEYFFEFVYVLLYAICRDTGQIVLERVEQFGSYFSYHEHRLKHQFVQWRERFKRHTANSFQQFIDPLSQFLSIFSYISAARSPKDRSQRIPMYTVVRVVCGRLLYPLRRFLVTLLNIALPVASIWILLMAIQYFTQIQYGLEVSYNGEHIGTVRSEAQFDEASRRMNERLIGTPTSNLGSASLTLADMSSSVFTDLDIMVNRMISLSGNDLFDGFGLYIDGQFIGALSESKTLLDNLVARLDSARSGIPDEMVSFSRRFSLRAGLYPLSSQSTPDLMEDYFNRQLSSEKSYTVQEGDTPSEIAAFNGISTSELVRLNPDVLTSLLVGDTLTIAHSVPYLRIFSQRLETSQERIAFPTERETDDTELIGYYKVEDEGEPGIREITSAVTYLDDEVTSREAVETRIIKQPVPKRIVVGSRKPKPSALSVKTGVDTTNDIRPPSGDQSFIWPVDGGKITMPIWGYAGHTGNDIAMVASGTTIRAAATGVVIKAQQDALGYGRHIIIQHPNGTQTLYAHNSANYVQVGDEVAQGQAIAAVGQTGNAFGNHCHFEIRQGGSYVDARQYIGYAAP